VIRIEGGILRIDGPLTMRTVAGLVGPGHDAIAAGARTVDLAGVTELDSAAIALLLDWSRSAGGTLALRGAPPGLDGLAKLYGVESMLGAAPPAS